tara:strand:+ start:8008 stop:8226 length:219 start_codon:yes stop_codon:yes gene_type:complete
VNDRHLETFYRTKEGMQKDLKKKGLKNVSIFFSLVLSTQVAEQNISHAWFELMRNAIAGYIVDHKCRVTFET